MKNSRIVYYDSFSIAVINPNGELRRIYCPFIVKCKKQVGDIQENSMVYVDQVFKDPDDLLAYLIGGNLYQFSDFTISIKF
jgi:hypothetical protein